MFPDQPPQPGMMPAGDDNADPPPVTIDAVMQLLRDDRMRGFRIDVETDSLIEADQDAEKQRRTEFVTGVGEFLGKVGPMVQAMPPLTPLVAELLKFAVRGYKVGAELEDVIEKTMLKVAKVLSAPPPPPAGPSPEEQMKLQIAQVKTQAEVQKANIGAQTAQIAGQAKIQQVQLQTKSAEMTHAHAAAQHQMDMAQAAMDHHIAQIEFHRKQQADAMEALNAQFPQQPNGASQ